MPPSLIRLRVSALLPLSSARQLELLALRLALVTSSSSSSSGSHAGQQSRPASSSSKVNSGEAFVRRLEEDERRITELSSNGKQGARGWNGSTTSSGNSGNNSRRNGYGNVNSARPVASSSPSSFKTSPSSAFVQNDAQRLPGLKKPTTTHHRRERADFEEALRMESARKREAMKMHGGKLSARKVKEKEDKLGESADQEMVMKEEPDGSDEIRKGEDLIGGRTVLPTLLDRAAKAGLRAGPPLTRASSTATTLPNPPSSSSVTTLSAALDILTSSSASTEPSPTPKSKPKKPRLKPFETFESPPLPDDFPEDVYREIWNEKRAEIVMDGGERKGDFGDGGEEIGSGKDAPRNILETPHLSGKQQAIPSSASIFDKGQALFPAISADGHTGPRRNPLGVQLLSPSLHQQLFPGSPLPKPPQRIIDISLSHLKNNGLSPTATSTAPEIDFEMPPLVGGNIREHFERIGEESAEPYLGLSKKFAEVELIEKPKGEDWVIDKPGWTKYTMDGRAESVDDLGGEEVICFDVEVMYKKSPYALMATAATPTAWYSWLSPALFAEPGQMDSDGKRMDIPSTLIPLTKSNGTEPAVVVGHNVGFDRARVLDEYNVNLTNNRWLDTLSLHVATKGITSVQRPAWMRRKKEKVTEGEVLSESQRLLVSMEGGELALDGERVIGGGAESLSDTRWEDVTSSNSLASVAELHCGIKMSKEVRDRFGDERMESATQFVPDLRLLLDYCATDVQITHSVLKKVLPLFLKSCPHPASFAGALGMGNPFLPIDNAWAEYIQKADGKYQELMGGVKAILWDLAYKLKKRGKVEGDPWTEQLDWTPKVARWSDEEVGHGEDVVTAENEGQEEEAEISAGVEEAPDLETELSAPQEVEEEAIIAELEDLSKPISPVSEPMSDIMLEADTSPPSRTDWPAFPRFHLPIDWEQTLTKWTEATPHSNNVGDVIPLVMQVTYRGYPVVEHPVYRWIICVPRAEADKILSLEGFSGVDRPEGILDSDFVYIKPPGKRISNIFAKLRAKEWKEGLYATPYPDLAAKLMAGVPRKELAGKIYAAATAYRTYLGNGLAIPSYTISASLPPAPATSKRATKAKSIHRADLSFWPKWFWDLTKSANQAAVGELDLTVKKRIAPLLLRMVWKGFTLHHSRAHGWTFRVPRGHPDEGQYLGIDFRMDPSKAKADQHLAEDEEAIYVKVPHSSGGTANVGNPLSKNFLPFIVNGTLKSAPAEAGGLDEDTATAARHAMEMNAQCSYWSGSRDRIVEQMAIYAKDMGGMGLPDVPGQNLGMILPKVICMGTVTRRAVESTWLTASNAKKNRVGSELKAMIRAPPGYAIVGADVDSEELWIASVMGDAQFGMHGASAIGWMTLEGTKAAGTDVHSKTAKILGTNRDYAKVFNYSRIYGAGVKHATQLLIQNNPDLSIEVAKKLADDLYAATKGNKTRMSYSNRNDAAAVAGRPIKKQGTGHLWHGGSESYLFNTLESIACASKPQTPGLGAGITDALRYKYLPKDGPFGTDYLPSRINWVVQSSGVDYLHMLIVSMDYLIKRYGIQARYMISVHDEVRYLVKEEDKYRAALALQAANAWTRALLSYNLGLDDMPQGVAFFSAVDIDNVFRKEVDMTCVTPSQPVPLPPGECLGMEELLAKTKGELGPVVNGTVGYIGVKPVSKSAPFRPPKLDSPDQALHLSAQATSDATVARLWLRKEAMA